MADKSKNRVSHIFLILTLVLVSTTPLAAMEVLSTSVSEEYSNGVNEKILTAIAGKLNTRIDIIHAPFKRRLYFMKNGTIDFMVGLLKRPEREDYIHFVHPPYKNRSDTVFFVPKHKSSRIRIYDDLNPLKIGTNIGSKYFQKFDDDTNLQKEPVSVGSANFKKLLLGRLDTIIYAESSGIALIHRLGIADKLDIAKFRFSRKKQVYIGISKKSGLMNNLPEVESVIQKMIQTNEIRDILTQYYTGLHLPVPQF